VFLKSVSSKNIIRKSKRVKASQEILKCFCLYPKMTDFGLQRGRGSNSVPVFDISTKKKVLKKRMLIDLKSRPVELASYTNYIRYIMQSCLPTIYIQSLSIRVSHFFSDFEIYFFKHMPWNRFLTIFAEIFYVNESNVLLLYCP